MHSIEHEQLRNTLNFFFNASIIKAVPVLADSPDRLDDNTLFLSRHSYAVPPISPFAMTAEQSSKDPTQATERPPSVPLLSPDISSYFIAGGCAGATSRTIVSPLERLKIIQ